MLWQRNFSDAFIVNVHSEWHSQIDMGSSQNREQLILNVQQTSGPRLKMECCFHTLRNEIVHQIWKRNVLMGLRYSCVT